jgi:exodeoxyribonuclease VII large subunit|tara:strand:- start:216 stop:1448 length:1233 start_codon:yes stop_codon:yes gene_type:complete
MTDNKLIDNLNNDNIPVFSVSEITKEITDLLEDKYSYVKIKGEISGETGDKYPEIYFTLKDDENVISAIIKRNKIPYLKLLPKDGLEVICTGKVTAYTRRDSKFQIDVDSISVKGEGQLLKIKEELRVKFKKLGWFDKKYKKKIPFIPNTIGIITSPSGSVIEDMKRIIYERFSRRIKLFPVTVQGDKAVSDIVNAINFFNEKVNSDKPDIIIIARGGGSIEDLWCFNDEKIVEGVFKSNIPIISAIGHEPDINLIDNVADVTVATPSHAAKLVVPERKQLMLTLKSNFLRFKKNNEFYFKEKKKNLISFFNKIPKYNVTFSLKYENFEKIKKRFNSCDPRFFNRIKENLNHIKTKFNIGSHINTLKRGYVYLKNAKDNSFITNSANIKNNTIISINFYDGKIKAITKKK